MKILSRGTPGCSASQISSINFELSPLYHVAVYTYHRVPYSYRLMCDGYIENKQDCHTEQAQSLLADRIKAMLRLMEQKYVV